KSSAVTPAPAASTAPAPPAWIQRSNANAQVLLEVLARFAPEQAGQFGVPGLDEQVLDLRPGVLDRSRAATKEAVAKLESRRASESDAAVLQDLDILITRAKENQEGQELQEKLMLPYINVHGIVF